MNFSYEQLMMFVYIGIGVAVLFLIVAVILFIVLKIPRAWSELSGSTERKAINEIRQKNSQPMSTTGDMGADVYNQMPTNVQNNGQKNFITANDKSVFTNKDVSFSNNNETTLLDYSGETELLDDTGKTELLPNMNETELLSDNGETELLTDNSGETELLVEDNESNLPNNQGTVVEDNNVYYGQTQVLDDNETEVLYEPNDSADFQLLEEIVLCSSNEIVA